MPRALGPPRLCFANGVVLGEDILGEDILGDDLLGDDLLGDDLLGDDVLGGAVVFVTDARVQTPASALLLDAAGTAGSLTRSSRATEMVDCAATWGRALRAAGTVEGRSFPYMRSCL